MTSPASSILFGIASSKQAMPCAASHFLSKPDLASHPNLIAIEAVLLDWIPVITYAMNWAGSRMLATESLIVGRASAQAASWRNATFEFPALASPHLAGEHHKN